MGCGGSGGGGGTTPPPDPVFTGNWSGAWDGTTAPPPGDDGTLAITIEADGDVTGTAHNEGRSEDGTVLGSIDSNGSINFVIDYPSHDCQVSGKVTATDTTLIGLLNLATPEYNRTIHNYLFKINLTKQP